MKILVIDDSPDALAVARARLACEGHEILYACDGKEGLETAGRDNPDLVLLDVDMPGMPGFEVCRRLKSEAITSPIPVIFLSGSSGADDKIKGLDLGGVDFVTKPFDAFELCARVRAALRTKSLQDLLWKYALIDSLTEVSNRRALDECLKVNWARHLRHEGRLSIIMVDIDHFKKVNDEFGHATGDEVLRRVARLLAAGCRESDTLARYGGEEFVVVAPEIPLQGVTAFAERLRMNISSRPLTAYGRALAVTASFGVADSEGRKSAEELLQTADEALYRAKSAGRNCVRE